MSEELTPKQARFVAAYVGESQCSGTQTVILAGHAPKSAHVERNPKFRTVINDQLDSLKTDGLRDRRQRIDSLKRQERTI